MDTATESPRHRRGGRRPGAGRPRKARPGPALASPRLPDVGDVVWHWKHVDAPEPGWICRPAVVLYVARPGDPGTPLSLTVFHGEAMRARSDVPFADEPRDGHWGWPRRQGRD